MQQRHDDEQPLNVGRERTSISELAMLLQEVVGFSGQLRFDSGKPDGRANCSTTRLSALGWRRTIDLHDGIVATYRWVLERADQRCG
jgi:nucleoside-diphosphate-sugar epimerase